MTSVTIVRSLGVPSRQRLVLSGWNLLAVLALVCTLAVFGCLVLARGIVIAAFGCLWLPLACLARGLSCVGVDSISLRHCREHVRRIAALPRIHVAALARRAI